MLYCTGDTHGEIIKRFSFRRNPELRTLTDNDTMFILGDFGLPFGPQTMKETKNVFDFLMEKPWTTIVIGGNHEDYDFWESCPQTQIYDGAARQAKIGNILYPIFFIDHITILNIEEKHILCIPKAESHDIWNLLDPNDTNFKRQKRILRKANLWFRVKHQTWWPQEKMDINENIDFMEQHEKEYFDYILSHDAPSLILTTSLFSYGFCNHVPTEGERYLEMLRATLNFNQWIHGHFHFSGGWNSIHDSRLKCLYTDIITL